MAVLEGPGGRMASRPWQTCLAEASLRRDVSTLKSSQWRSVDSCFWLETRLPGAALPSSKWRRRRPSNFEGGIGMRGLIPLGPFEGHEAQGLTAFGRGP